MSTLELCLLLQCCLTFGLAGIFWPEKFMPLFEALLFPWAANSRVVKINSLAAIGLSLLLATRLLMG